MADLLMPNQINVVRWVMRDHPEIDRMNEATRGRIVDYVCYELRGTPYGRKSRNSAGTDLNTDGLAFMRPDGLFEIADVISGTDGSATWDVTGPFRQGENGYWVPARPVGDTTPTTPTTPAVDLAAVLAAIEALRVRAEEQQLELAGDFVTTIATLGHAVDDLRLLLRTQEYTGQARVLGQVVTFTLRPKV